MRKISRRLALGLAGCIIAVPVALEASPALACTGSACSSSGSVAGTATVPTAITLSLSATSFTVTTPAGATTDTTGTGGTGYAVTATVATNDTSGYLLTEALTSPVTGFTASGNTLSGSNIYPLQINAGTPGSNDNQGQQGYGSAFGVTGAAATIVNSTVVSAASGDNWGLAWQFTVPGNQPGGAYTGSIATLALAN